MAPGYLMRLQYRESLTFNRTVPRSLSPFFHKIAGQDRVMLVDNQSADLALLRKGFCFVP